MRRTPRSDRRLLLLPESKQWSVFGLASAMLASAAFAPWAAAQAPDAAPQRGIRVIESPGAAVAPVAPSAPVEGIAPASPPLAPAPNTMAAAERAAALRRVDAAILDAEARLASHETRLARFAEINQPTPSASYYPSWTLPRSPSYSPLRVAPQVDWLTPVETPFTHVVEQVTRQRDEAALELDALHAQRAVLLGQRPAAAAARGDAQAALAAARQDRLAQIDAEIELAEFRRQTLERRIEQFQQSQRAVYSAPLSDLGDKLLLDLNATELRLDTLAAERNALSAGPVAAPVEREKQRIRVVDGADSPETARSLSSP